MKLVGFCVAMMLLPSVDSDQVTVGTEPFALIANGSRATLKYIYLRSTYGIYWSKQNGHIEHRGDTVVHLDTFFKKGERSGRGLDEGRFNISDDFSLVISPVLVQDEGPYSCIVSDVTTGSTYLNSTELTVFVYADKPYVKIKPCEHFKIPDQSEHLEETQCTKFNLPNNQTSFQLSCSVIGARPNVSLTWMSNKTDVGTNYALMSKFEDRGDGTYDQTLTLMGRVNETMNGTEFSCLAKGLAVDGVANNSVTFFKAEIDHDQPDNQDTDERPNVVVIAVTLVIACLILIVSAVIIVVRKREKKQGNPSFPYHPPADQAPTELKAKSTARENKSRHEPQSSANDKDGDTSSQ